MFVVSLLASQALAADWSASGITGTPNMVAGFDFIGRPVSLDPLPYTSGLVQSLVPAAVSSAVQQQVPPMVSSAIAQQVPGLASSAIQLQVPALMNNAIQQQVPAMCVDTGEAMSLIDDALLDVPAICDTRIGLLVPPLVEAAIVARVPELSLDATEGAALVNAAILAQVPGLALAEIGATVPDLVDEAILEQVPALCVDEIDARVPGAINAAILAQVPGLSMDSAETLALVDAEILAQVPDICLDSIDAVVPDLIDAAILAQVPAMSVDVAEATALIDAAILAQVPDICLDNIDAVVPDLIDAAILDQVPGLAQDEIDATVPEMIDDLAPPMPALSFGEVKWVAWTQIGAASTSASGMVGNRLVFNLHVEETAARIYDEIEVIVTTGTTNNVALALYALDPSGVPGQLLWSGAPISGTPASAKSSTFASGTWTAAGSDVRTPGGDLALSRGETVLLAEHHVGITNLRIFNGGSARALGVSGATGQAFTGWELPIATFGVWPVSGTAASGRSGSPLVLSLRVKP